MSWKPRTFKMRYLPADDCSIDALCNELVSSGVVILYGEGLAYIPGFTKHQHVNPRESASDLPAPDGVKDAGPRKVGKTLREAVFERDGHKCVRCGSTEHLQADHILPQSAGGPHIIENLRTLCRPCNAGRPVSGQGLIDDLQKDGHTIESLRVKFGIDASILELTGREEGKGREGKGKEGKGTSEAAAPAEGASAGKRKSKEEPADFQPFYDLYPRKDGRQDAVTAWGRMSQPDRDAAMRAMPGFRQRMSGTEARFIPLPATWLNGKRWQDQGADAGGRSGIPTIPTADDFKGSPLATDGKGRPLPTPDDSVLEGLQ